MLRLLTLALLTPAILFPFASASAETLDVAVQDVRSARGDIQVDVYGPGRKRAARQRMQATAGVTRLTVPGLAAGSYAIEVYHDENNNRRLDTGGLLGMPVEGYSFSNNARIRMGPPSFDAMRVVLPKGTRKATAMRMRYPRKAR